MFDTITTDIWSTVGQILIIMLGGGLVLLLEHLRQTCLEWYRNRRLHALARSVMANRRVHTLLVELRTKLNADRAYIILFHNGQVFSNKNPVWRASCTQESCKAGISHQIEDQQNMLASSVWDCLAPLFDHQCSEGCTAIKDKDHPDHYIFKFDVNEMADSFTKCALISGGVKTTFETSVHDQKKEIVGLVAVNYCVEDVPDAKSITSALLEASSSIQYALET